MEKLLYPFLVVAFCWKARNLEISSGPPLSYQTVTSPQLMSPVISNFCSAFDINTKLLTGVLSGWLRQMTSVDRYN